MAYVDENGVTTLTNEIKGYFDSEISTGISSYISNNLLNLVYPVGSIFLSVNSTSPATLFGGTWLQIEDKFLLAAGSTYLAGDTGGEATHTLTINEMPAHRHGVYYRAVVGNGSQWTIDPGTKGTANDGEWAIQDAGGNGAHNNMPPYLVVYVWKRTA